MNCNSTYLYKSWDLVIYSYWSHPFLNVCINLIQLSLLDRKLCLQLDTICLVSESNLFWTLCVTPHWGYNNLLILIHIIATFYISLRHEYNTHIPIRRTIITTYHNLKCSLMVLYPPMDLELYHIFVIDYSIIHYHNPIILVPHYC